MLIIVFYNPLHHHHPFPHHHIIQKIFHRHLIRFFIQHILLVSVCLEILRYKRHYLYLSRRKTHQEVTDNCDISAIIKLGGGVPVVARNQGCWGNKYIHSKYSYLAATTIVSQRAHEVSRLQCSSQHPHLQQKGSCMRCYLESFIQKILRTYYMPDTAPLV